MSAGWTRPRARAGHALMELVVALPILAIGGAAVAGIMTTSGALSFEAERRFEAAVNASALLDSLRAEARDAPAVGGFEALGQTVEWRWDGSGGLELRHAGAFPVGGGDVRWVLRSGPTPVADEGG